MKNFYVTAKFQMKLPDGVDGVDGGIIMPAKIALPVVERRDLEGEYPHLATRFLDPQVYLSTLNAGSARKACAQLYSYGWFPGQAGPAYDSAQQSQQLWRRNAEQEILQRWQAHAPASVAEIEDCIRRTVEFQLQIGCAAVILPSPMTAEPHSRFEVETQWLEMGMEIAGRVAPDLPRYATIALSDRCLRGSDPWRSILLDEILDQVTAREPDGAYIVIELANEDSYYITDPNTVGSLLRLCDGLKRAGLSKVIVAYAGIAGLMALTAGADAWTSGWYRGERRLRLTDFYSQEGRAKPAYYSHALAAEFHMQTDLDRAVAAGFLNRIADPTIASEGLLRALGDGRGTAPVVEWSYDKQNKTASMQHFFLAAVRETTSLAWADDQTRVDITLRWLEGAAQLSNDLFAALGQVNPRTSLNHQHSWLAAFRAYLQNR